MLVVGQAVSPARPRMRRPHPLRAETSPRRLCVAACWYADEEFVAEALQQHHCERFARPRTSTGTLPRAAYKRGSSVRTIRVASGRAVATYDEPRTRASMDPLKTNRLSLVIRLHNLLQGYSIEQLKGT